MIATKPQIREDLGLAQSNGVLEAAKAGARQNDVPLPFMLATASRESDMGAALTDGTDRHGKHHGVWQIHEDYHTAFVRSHSDRDDKAHAVYAGGLLREGYERFGSWPAALAYFNSGAEGIREILRQGGDLDKVTTGQYVADTTQRADYLEGMLEEKGIQAEAGVAGTGVGWPVLVGVAAAGYGAYRYRKQIF